LARLIIFEESNQETVFETFELTDSSILIGSDPENHLILETPDIDSSHASLELRDNRWIIQDLGGPGGTVVNGTEIEGPQRLRHDDLIELGFVKMKFQDPRRRKVKPPRRTGGTRNAKVANVPDDEADISGRVWFATVATATIAVIFIIIFLLIVAHFLEIISIGDLLPPWLSA